jgi:two-component system, NtrC family, sensor kinase
MTRSRARTKESPEPAAEKRIPFSLALFDALDLGLCFMDEALRVVAVNPAMEKLFASKRFDGAKPCPETEGGPSGLCGRCPAAEALTTGRPAVLSIEEVGPDDRPRQLEITCHPVADASGNFFGVVETARDVTQRKRAEQEMALAIQDIEMLLGSIRSILVSLDGENRIRRFNASAEAVLGLTAASVVGRDFFAVELDWDGEAVREAIATSRKTLHPVRVDEVRCRIPDDGERLLGLTVNPVPSAQGETPGVLLLGQDLSDIKARELKTVHERRMQAIGQLASGIAHEINTPIQYVGYNAGFLDESFSDVLGLLAAYGRLAEEADGQGGEALAAALREVRAKEAAIDLVYLRQEIPSAIANTRKGIDQVAEIVRAMRQMSHPGTGDMLFFDVNASVRDIVTVTRNAWKHVAEVQLDLAPELPMVYGLPHEVSQVLLNVVLNATQAVEERVIREPWIRGRIDISTSVVGEHIVVAVSDNGPGISEDVQGRIFDPFFTTKAVGKGTGQGLAISHAVMSRHCGGIDFKTCPGEGTTFFVRFPAEGARDGKTAEA